MENTTENETHDSGNRRSFFKKSALIGLAAFLKPVANFASTTPVANASKNYPVNIRHTRTATYP